MDMAVFKVVAVVLPVLLTGTLSQAAGQWQGTAPPPLAEEEVQAHRRASQFLVLNTGGSGGMFGQGDLRRNLLDVAFWHDGQHGAVCGDAGAFYTADGGLSWQRIREDPRKEYPGAKGVRYYSVAISGAEEIWLVEGEAPSRGRHLWHTTDAGRTWEDVSERLPGELKSVSDLEVRGPHVWLLAGDQSRSSYRSDDGGQTWQRLSVLPGARLSHHSIAVPISAAFNKLKTAYVLGLANGKSGQRVPALARTDDGGRTWRRVDMPVADTLPKDIDQYRIAFATPEAGMIALPAPGLNFVGKGAWEKKPGATASVLVTTDGGGSWTRRALPGEELAVSALWLDPDDPEHAFAGVWNGFVDQKGEPREGPALYETFDGGRRWATAIRGRPQINAIFGLDGRRVWAVGNREGFQANDVVAILEQQGGRD